MPAALMRNLKRVRILFILVKIVAGVSMLPFFPVVFLLAAMAGGGPSLLAPLAAILGLGVVLLMAGILVSCFTPGPPKWYVSAAAVLFPSLMLTSYSPWFLK